MLRLLVLCFLCVAALPTRAHTLSTSHVDATLIADGNVALEVDVALRDLALTFPLDANRDETVTWGELVALRPTIERWAMAGVVLSAAGDDCIITSTGFGIRRYDDGTYAALQMRARCPSDGAVSLRYTLLFDRDPQHRALVTVHQGDAATSAIASRGRERVTLAPDSGHPFLEYLREGVHHILIGYDHLAFLVSLLLPAALVRVQDQWQPADSLRGSFAQVLAIVTAFTFAHSLTLGLSALGWIVPASRPVEAAIAASVLLAALNNLRPVVTGRLWMVGFAFGLIHGFGFAGALSELGLPANSRLLALVGFNLGVEAGQLLVVGMLLPMLYLVRRQRMYARSAMPVASIAIAGLAAWWLLQRIAA